MRHLDLLNGFRELISQLRREVEAASAMNLYDSHKVSEQVMCGLLRELCGFSNLRNLNSEQNNFPGIDLADDEARISFQITATADIAKVKNTLEKFVSHNLYERYNRLIVYVLTTKQGSYSQQAIDNVSGNMFSMRADRDIWDYQELCAKAADSPPAHLEAAVNHLKSYLRGVPIGLADEDIDPPPTPPEELFANLLNINFPPDLYVAQLNRDIMANEKKGRPGRWRDAVRAFTHEAGVTIPSAYVVHNGTLITFFNLCDLDSPYRQLIERGTEEAISSSEFWKIDINHENAFKSLLRFSLQQRLFEERVHWYNDDKQFVFLPRSDHNDLREETWQGDKKSKRMVYARQYQKKDRSKISVQKHFSFSVDFHNMSNEWVISITPSWFFSYGEDFKKSGFGHDNLSWIKRQENNRAVLNHFRFITAWLKAIDSEDLFSQTSSKSHFLSFGDNISLSGAPHLDESKWASLPDITADEAITTPQRLFRS